MLTTILRERAAATPDARAFTFLESGEREAATLTWAELDRRSRTIASAIRGRVRGADSRVLILLPPGLEFVTAFVGSLHAGTIAIAAYPPAGGRADRTALRLRGMIDDAGVSLVVSHSSVDAKRAALEAYVPELGGLDWLNVDEAEDGEAVPVDATWPGPHDVAFLQYTSGSTSRPRGVMVTHGNLLHNLSASARLAGHGPGSAGVSWLPVNHDMGLIEGVLQPVFSGFPVWLMAPAAFLQRPVRWLGAISRVRATHSGGPDFAYSLCVRRISDADRESLDLSSWRIAFNGSEPVRRGTLEAFHRTFGERGFRWDAFRPAYGLAESTLLVASQPLRARPVLLDVDPGELERGRVRSAPGSERRALVGCGSADSAATIAIVDPVRRTRCAPDTVGEIWVRSPSVAAGYWNRPAETFTVFKARIAGTGEGPFLRTGDLGFVRGDQLFVTGRLKDLIVVRGLKHYPQDIELTAEGADAAVRAGSCAAFSLDPHGDERVAIVAEIEAVRSRLPAEPIDHPSVIDAIRLAVAEAHGLPLARVVLVSPGTLPRTTSGKLQRYVCREALRARTITAIADWSDADLTEPRERAS